MDAKQISILNALVTFAAENIPGGLSEDEAEVAKMVGGWALFGARRTHNYKIVNASTSAIMENVANSWAKNGWRIVACISDTRPGYAHQFILERPVGQSHPDD